MTQVTAIEVTTTSTKPSNGETLITLVLDETGSMNSCWDSTISSVNDYLGSQKGQDGVARVSLFKFSTSGWNASMDRGEQIRTVFENKVVGEVEELNKQNYKPNGGTNLYDAIGSTIRRIEAQLEPLSEVPDVLVVIVTDGGENASTEFKLEDIKSLVQAKEADGWTFIYLGANQDAWQVGSSFGLSKGQTMTYSTANMAGTMSTLANATTTYRSLRSSGAVERGTVTKNFFAPDSDSE
jgi:hypothetical protein